ncbi:MAG: aspartate aminotransferase family protein [Rickettsiales bacterium]|nr:aspartate aminotransferase family protein [Rickettsiales bacterium]
MSDISSKHNVKALSDELIAKGRQYYVPNYKPRDMILDRADGSTIWDLEGNDYIDFGGGIAVCGLGYGDEELLEALVTQAKKLWHTSNIFFTEPPIKLSEALVEAVPFAKRVYLCNSGAEANEAAFKLARKYAADKGKSPEEREIISFVGSFHGRTYATVTATAQPKYHEGFEPMPAGFVYCDTFNDEEALKKVVSDKTCAILIEPVQGEGGVVPAKPGFLKFLRKLCDERDILLICDEIQCGMGRTGRLFAHMHDEIEPDIMTSAKALGSGLPIGAMLVGAKAENTFQFGSHGSTFGGNPVMSAVALKSLEKINQPELLASVEAKAQKVKKALEAIGEDLECFTEVRGSGLMIGAELTPKWHGKAGELSEICRTHGVLVLIAGPNVLRFLPPLTISEEELQVGLQRVSKALAVYFKKESPSNRSGGLGSRIAKWFGG